MPSTPVRARLRVALGSLSLLLALPGRSADLPRSSPESQGVRSDALTTFVERADRDGGGFHSLTVVRHGHVIAEGWWAPYGPERRHELYSLSKSFTSTAVGLAIAEGRFTLDDTVLSFFPEDAPADPSPNLRSMRVRDLLRMGTGHQDEPPSGGEGLSARSFLAHPVPHKPGTHFKYNTPATFMLSAIVQKTTGQTVLDYLRPRLFEPLGIENPAWGTNHQGISLGGYGLRIRTGDIARFGQLLLQHGRWEGRQLVPAGWVDEATSLRIANGSNPASDWDQGYGYQFWQCRHGAYRGDGAFGQYCVVMPALDAVVAVTAGAGDMQRMLDLIWEHLLPAFGTDPLPENPDARRRLADTLGHLSVPGPDSGRDAQPRAGILGRTYEFTENTQGLGHITLETAPDGATLLTLDSRGRRTALHCAADTWSEATGPAGPIPETALAVRGVWTDPDTFTVQICAVETPHILNLQLRFDGDRVRCEGTFNVRFGSTRLPTLEATAR